MTASATLPAGKILLLGTGLSASVLVGLSAQFPAVNLADIQGGLAATADEASWITTVYSMTSFAGIITSVPLLRALGLGRYLLASALIFAATAAGCATSSELGTVIALRALQGLAAGGFGPAAFVAIFMVAGGPRLPFAMTLLSFALLLPATIGPIFAALLQDAFGWPGLFGAQAGIGIAIAIASAICVPRNPPDWSALRTDWVAIILLSIALAMVALALSQGTRRFWFESDMILRATAAAVGAAAGFLFLARFSPIPIMAPRLLLRRDFGVPIALNLVFRIGLVVTGYLIPQFLIVVQGYRPRELAATLLWILVPQLLALPLSWRLMHAMDVRSVAGLGLLLSAFATALAIGGTSEAAAPQFHLTLAILGVGQMLFLAPSIVIGTETLQSPDLPTASLVFNIITLGGTLAGVGLLSQFVTQREKFHSNILTEAVSLYDSFDAGRIAGLAAAFEARLTDDALAMRQAVSVTSAVTRRQAWVLSFNDAFLLVTLLFAISALGVLLLGRCGPLGRRHADMGKQS